MRKSIINMSPRGRTDKEKEVATDQELFQQYADFGDREEFAKQKNIVRNELVKRNRPLVSFIITKYYNRPEQKKIYEDLMQEGTIGLMNAIEGYDLSLGFRFSTYSSWWIRQAINNYLGNVDPLIRIPNHIRSAQSKLIKIFNEENNGQMSGEQLKDCDDENMAKKPTFSEMVEDGCSDLQLTERMTDSVKSAFTARKITYMDQDSKRGSTLDGGQSTTLKDRLPSTDDTLDQMLDKDALVSVVSEGLKRLSPKKRLVLFLRFNVFNNSNNKEEES